MTTTEEERPTGFVYLDGESTGLDHRRHDFYEVAWAVDTGAIYRMLLPHRLRYAQPAALEVGGYWSRDIPGEWRRRNSLFGAVNALTSDTIPGTVDDLVKAFTNPDGSKRTLVCANPNFDANMLFGKVIAREHWTSRLRRALRLPAPEAPEAPWHYRLLDIEAYAAGAFGWGKPAGLRNIRDWLTARGYDIPAPNHSAAGDVATLRAIHFACWDYLGKPYAHGLAPRINPRQEPVA